MAFIELYADRYEGKWFDPDDLTGVELIDLDSAAGVDDTCLIESGSIYLGEGGIREGISEMRGVDENEVEREMLAALEKFETEDYADLSEEEQNLVISAIVGSWSYYGLNASRTEGAVTLTEESKQELIDEWGIDEDDIVVAQDMEAAIWQILNRLGVIHHSEVQQAEAKEISEFNNMELPTKMVPERVDFLERLKRESNTNRSLKMSTPKEDFASRIEKIADELEKQTIPVHREISEDEKAELADYESTLDTMIAEFSSYFDTSLLQEGLDALHTQMEEAGISGHWMGTYDEDPETKQLRRLPDSAMGHTSNRNKR